MQQIRALEREFSELHDVASQNPADADVRFRIGDLARKLGKRELARTWFRAALSLQPSHAAAAAALAELQSAPTNH
jgi:tetratricopeptide (TPR) repeat protein